MTPQDTWQAVLPVFWDCGAAECEGLGVVGRGCAQRPGSQGVLAQTRPEIRTPSLGLGVTETQSIPRHPHCPFPVLPRGLAPEADARALWPMIC